MQKKNMARKIAGLVVALVVLLSIGLIGAQCDITSTPTLEEYKASAITALQEYADALYEDDYCEVNWKRIEGYVEEGIEAINAAETKPAVRTARDNAKAAVGAVQKEDANMNGIEFTEGVFNWSFDGTNFDGTDRISAIIRSSCELVSFFDSYKVAWFNAPIWEHYGSSFFEDNALLLFFFQTSGANSFFVDTVRVNNDKMTLYIVNNINCDGVSNDVEFIASFIVEVRYKDVQGIASFGTNFRLGQ